MKSERLKSLDQFSDESEGFETRFEQLPTGEKGELERARLVEEITRWMQECSKHGRFVPAASAERRAFRSLLERWNSRLRDIGHYVEGIDSLAAFEPHAGIALIADCPYPGLEPYTQSQRGGFFGREALVSSSVAHLEQRGNRILLIVGASGSGKSSLALAGILPQLAEHHDGAWLFGPRLTPGAHPLAELSAAVTQAVGQPDQASVVERGLAANPSGALSQIAEVCQNKPLMLFIDQFEELLTMCRDAKEQSVFAQVLCALSAPTVLPGGFSCRTLLTLRTDHLARFESNSALTQLYMRLVGEDNQHSLSPIGFEDVKRAIKGPAEEVGVRFIPATLIDRLASQTAGLSNGLPLLQFALRRLWDTRPKNEAGEPLDLINEEMVQGLPDVEQALGTVADGIFHTFSDPQQRVCERLLLELVVLDESFEEPLRRRRNEAELTLVLEARFRSSGDVATVIDKFVSAGLLRRFGAGPDSRLEVAHEALLRHWKHIYPLLTGAEVKARLHLVKQIGREAAAWAAQGGSADYLSLKGERLARAIAFASDGWLAEAEAAAYVEACRARGEAEKLREKEVGEAKRRAEAAERASEEAALRAKRAQLSLWRLVAVTVLALTVGVGWAWYREHNESSARELAMAASAQLDQNSQGSLLLSIEASKKIGGELSPEIESALRSSIRAARVGGVFKGYGRTSIHAAAYTPDGSVLALGGSLGGVAFWDVATGLQRKALFAHVDDVKAIAFSPDGRKMATGSADGKVVIWDVKSGTPLHILGGHVDKVNALAFSRPDGRLLATAGDDASLRIWNVSSGKPAGRALYGHIGSVDAVAFGRDERQLVTAGEDRQVILWDGLEGRILYSFRFREVFDINLSTDGSLLAVATGLDVEIWDTAARVRRWSLTGHTNSVSKVRFSRDPRLVATAGFDSTVRVWRLPLDDRKRQQQAKELVQIRTEPSTDVRKTLITALAFRPGGDAVAAAFADGSTTIWNVAAGGELLTLVGHESPVRAVAFSPDGGTVAAAGGSDGQVLAWDLSGRRNDIRLKDIRAPAKAVAFSEAGALAVGSDKDVLVRLPGAADAMRLAGHTDVVNDLAFSPDGSRLVSGSHDRTAIVWELPSGQRKKVLEGHSDDVVSVAYSPDGKTIATGSKDRMIILWGADTFDRRHELKGHFLGILELAFTSDSKRLVSGGKDKTVRIWDVATGKEEAILGAHGDVVNAVAIHGNRLATGADDGIRLWDLGSLAPLPVFPARSDGAQSLAFSRDGRYLAAGADDGVVRVYAMQGRELVELANRRVRRGWTPEECRWFLERRKGFFGREECPRTRSSILDEAYRSFEKFDFKTGERLLREAQIGGTADAEAIDDEVNSRLGAAFMWAASNVMENPEVWKEAAKGEDPREVVAKFLSAAGEKLKESAFDPESRLRGLIAYQDAKRARQLARQGELKKSADSFRQARNAGWEMSSEPEDAARQLLTVNVLSEVSKRLRSERVSSEDARNSTQAAEGVLKLFPGYGPGHQVLAALYERQGDYASAKRHYLDAADTKEKSASPWAELAASAFREYERRRDIAYAKDTVNFARQALARDRGSDLAWFLLGYAEHFLKNEKNAVEALDQVSPDSEFFADAMNIAGSIYFEYLEDDQAAHQRISRAAQVAPDNLNVLENYAESLLASGRDAQAKLAATRARERFDAKPYEKAAMSFVIFAAELLSGDRGGAIAELDQIDRFVRLAAEETKVAIAKREELGKWEYKGTRRSLERRSSAGSTEQRSALLNVLTFVETNGQGGTLSDMGRLLRAKPANG
jgi:WD40 repeat protein/energy-coupling factor transporter ATP-binding protein EcfA2